MFRWTDEARERAIDLACVQSLTVDDVAECIGASRKCMFNFYRDNRAQIEGARSGVEISDRMHAEVLALWGDNYPRDAIAALTGLSADVVRRLILAAELDEQPDDLGASLELLALQVAHPDRMYMDDLRALCGEPRMRPTAPDAGLRSAA